MPPERKDTNVPPMNQEQDLPTQEMDDDDEADDPNPAPNKKQRTDENEDETVFMSELAR